MHAFLRVHWLLCGGLVGRDDFRDSELIVVIAIVFLRPDRPQGRGRGSGDLSRTVVLKMWSTDYYRSLKPFQGGCKIKTILIIKLSQ